MTWCPVSESRQFGRLACALLAICCWAAANCTAWAEEFPVQPGPGGRLVYDRDEQGNHVPDFSHCGYAGADRAIPFLPVKATVAPADGDDGPRIQAAIDQVAALPVDADGHRGAVLLAPGRFEVAGQLRLSASGVVLRGSGAGQGGTTLLATGVDRRALVRIEGVNDRQLRGGTPARVVNKYVPVGATTLRLDSADGLHVGDTVLVVRPSTAEWNAELGMKAFGVGWRPGTRDIRWDRVITAVDGSKITLDAPITTAIESRLGGATVQPYDWPGRIENVGVEDLRMASVPGSDSPRDEDHAWFGVTVQNAQNAWVRRVEFRHFAGGAVALWENTKWVTVEDCISLDPVSEIGGYRRHTCFTQGQLTLFLRCWSEHGRHDFAVGHCAPGPNAFVNCRTRESLGDSGPIESWASGVLYDNVRIDGGGLSLENHWSSPPGTGWSAGNCMLWQCRAATVRSFRPPGAVNWAIGCWADFAGDGMMMAPSDTVRPQSLYQAQLGERLGRQAGDRVGPILGQSVGATNPTVAEAARFVAQSDRPARQLIDVIRERFQAATAQETQRSGGSSAARPEPRVEPSPSPSLKGRGTLAVRNGWLVIGDQLKTGGDYRPTYWRGTMRPDEAPALGPAITRFAPGRVGVGLTDDLNQVADMMVAGNVAVYEHHYGLWYDRRRDDHLMVRRADGDVAPPFYEQPFARTGQGRAWDGLSKYDLTRPDPWYWKRLDDFAQLCDQRGLVLVHQHYFQHNILEAGAHWADCPWRPANNVNDMHMPEPPVYIGDKRQFMAPIFYDVTDPDRRALHRGYIRQCLDGLADSSNVIQMTSAEYTGPLAFTQFWLDTIAEWEQEHGRDVIVALSTPKDVQDAILADPVRGPHVDVIDIRYWCYTAGGGLYAPAGGQNLSPRQFLRKNRQRPGGFAAIVKAVREYRTRYPDKAVTYYAGENCPSISNGWAVLMGGGSLPDVRLPDELAKVIPTMRPVDGVVSGPGHWCIGREGGDWLIYTENRGQSLQVTLPGSPARYRVHWIDTQTGETTTGGTVTSGRPIRLRPKSEAVWLERSSSN